MGYYQARPGYGYRRRRRYQFHYPHRRVHFRRRRRRYYPRRRRYHHRRRTEVLREHKPRKQKHITVFGWEILGIAGTTFFWDAENKLKSAQNIKNNQEVGHLSKLGISPNNAKPNFNPDNQNTQCQFKDFCGGFGQASISLAGLASRARYGMARFSETMEDYPWIKFKGAKFQLVPCEQVDYLFRLNNRAPYKTSYEVTAESKWNHPANLLLHGGTRVVESIYRSKCCKWKTIRYRPPPEFEGWYDVGTFASFNLVQYMWTTVSLNNPMGIAPYQRGTTNLDESKGQIHNQWWKDGCVDPHSNIKNPIWYDRKEYDKQFVQDTKSWWDVIWDTNKKPKHSPFCPPVFTTNNQNVIWCRYKFWFTVGGGTIENRIPAYPLYEIDPPKTCPGTCQACIKEGDLDSDGLLTESSLRRITGTHHPSRRELLAKLCKKLRRVLQKRRAKSVTWGKKQTRYFSQ
ncbi:MAG: ORF1 protein [Anelloviridae sp.]|nr:MAG: ORF1 protein [Anelloviridae sp.]